MKEGQEARWLRCTTMLQKEWPWIKITMILNVREREDTKKLKVKKLRKVYFAKVPKHGTISIITHCVKMCISVLYAILKIDWTVTRTRTHARVHTYIHTYIHSFIVHTHWNPPRTKLQGRSTHVQPPWETCPSFWLPASCRAIPLPDWKSKVYSP